MRTVILGLLLFFTAHMYATAQPDTFAQFPNKYFVESGSYEGEGISYAAKAGFPHIYSIELDEGLYTTCLEKFANNSSITLFHGDSGKILFNAIKDIDEPITFWLDGHYAGGTLTRGDTWSPILAELECIKQHPIKNHTILIDDVRQFGQLEFDYVTLDEIAAKIYEINPDYTIRFVDGYVENDILVAEIR